MRNSKEIFNELCEVRFQLENADAIYDLTGGSYIRSIVDRTTRNGIGSYSFFCKYLKK